MAVDPLPERVRETGHPFSFSQTFPVKKNRALQNLKYQYRVKEIVSNPSAVICRCGYRENSLEVEFMTVTGYTRRENDDAFTGLEAAIVLIAFVVVAAVFSYVVLGAGFFTTQKSQETVYKSVEQATSNIQVIGQVYGVSSVAEQINSVQFNIGLAPGAPDLDISKMIITVSQPGSSTIQQLPYSSTLSTTTFTCTDPSANDAPLPTLSGQKQGNIKISLATPLTRNNKISIEIRPSVGAALPFSKTAGATIYSSNVLS
jgi:flagellin FlaB